jgi:uncharacterized protein with WD repeat
MVMIRILLDYILRHILFLIKKCTLKWTLQAKSKCILYMTF